MGSAGYRIVLTIVATEMIEKIRDQRVRDIIYNRIEALGEAPEKQGKPLIHDLSGYRSVRAVGQRYRIVYSVERKQVTVVVLGVGIRREGDKHDIYQLMRKLVGLSKKH
jgi:mRNA interferase RelE/StbE